MKVKASARLEGMLQDLVQQVEASRRTNSELQAEIVTNKQTLDQLRRETAEANRAYNQVNGALQKLRTSLAVGAPL
jgi:hypothetical protein